LNQKFSIREVAHAVNQVPKLAQELKGAGVSVLDRKFSIHDIAHAANQVPKLARELKGAGLMKGSPEMREKMRKLREMRKKK